MISFLITFLIFCIVFGLIWYLTTLLPFSDKLIKAIQAIVIIIAILYLLSAVLGYAPMPEYRR